MVIELTDQTFQETVQGKALIIVLGTVVFTLQAFGAHS
jgi:hypothetical protein